MTSDHPLRRVLAHVCSSDTMARVVDPVLADMRFENGRPVWRGYLTLARALTVHAALSLPGAVSRLWTDDDRAIPRAVSMCVVTALLIAVPLVAPPALNVGRLYSWRAVILLVPQALVLALPASLLVAIPMGFRRTTTGRVVVRGLVLSVLCAAVTLVLMIRVMPDANQAFRVEVAQRLAPRPVHVPRGSIEMTLRELREHIEVLRLTPGGVRVARRLEYTYHLKLALSMVALPLGLLSISMARSTRSRMRLLLLGAGTIVMYGCVLFAVDAVALNVMERSAAIPPAAAAWLPVAILSLVAALAHRALTPRAQSPVA